MIQLIPLSPHSLAPVKSRLVLFWCQLTQVVLEKRPLNGFSSSGSNILLWRPGIVIDWL